MNCTRLVSHSPPTHSLTLTHCHALSAHEFAISSTENALRWGFKDALTLSKVCCYDVHTTLPNAIAIVVTSRRRWLNPKAGKSLR